MLISVNKNNETFDEIGVIRAILEDLMLKNVKFDRNNKKFIAIMIAV